MRRMTITFDWDGTEEELTEALAPLNDKVKAQPETPMETLSYDVGPVTISANYASVNLIKDVTEPWLRLFSGDEWGEIIGRLHAAIHTDYGLGDEEVALVAKLVWRAVEQQHGWWIEEGQDYFEATDEDLQRIYAKAKKAREYWTKGGNLTGSAPHIEAATATAQSLPGWVFGE